MNRAFYHNTTWVISSLLFSFSSWGNEAHHSPYAGQQHRAIKSLSAKDIEALRNGQGWGLAKAAELNGYPGPLHVLELREELALTAQQLKAIEGLYQDMLHEARPLGEQLIAQERQINEAFATGQINEELLSQLLSQVAKTRGDLRFVHLQKHLLTHQLLNAEQIAVYQRLRGYDADDPCAATPQGHDPMMWKKHHGCD